MVTELARLTRSAAEIGEILDRLGRAAVRLVVLDLDIDTDTDSGQLAARALATVGAWEHERLSERTRKGLAAARAHGPAGRPAVSDRPELVERITTMRASGMTLQAIADALNAQGEPTVRGGARWRPSSVQSALGYKRRPRPSGPTKANGRERKASTRPTAEGKEGRLGRRRVHFKGPAPGGLRLRSTRRGAVDGAVRADGGRGCRAARRRCGRHLLARWSPA